MFVISTIVSLLELKVLGCTIILGYFNIFVIYIFKILLHISIYLELVKCLNFILNSYFMCACFSVFLFYVLLVTFCLLMLSVFQDGRILCWLFYSFYLTRLLLGIADHRIIACCTAEFKDYGTNGSRLIKIATKSAQKNTILYTWTINPLFYWWGGGGDLGHLNGDLPCYFKK